MSGFPSCRIPDLPIGSDLSLSPNTLAYLSNSHYDYTIVPQARSQTSHPNSGAPSAVHNNRARSAPSSTQGRKSAMRLFHPRREDRRDRRHRTPITLVTGVVSMAERTILSESQPYRGPCHRKLKEGTARKKRQGDGARAG
jgi:hypothetical protein